MCDLPQATHVANYIQSLADLQYGSLRQTKFNNQ